MEAARKLRRAVDASENKIKNYWLRNRDILFYLKSFKVIEKYLPFRKGNFGESFLQVFQNGVLSVSRLCLVELYTQFEALLIYHKIPKYFRSINSLVAILAACKLDHTIQKDATSKVSSSPRPETGSTCKANVPSIIIHNGSPTIFCNSPEALPSSEGSHSQAVEKGEALINFEMSLGDDAVTSQPIPSVNNAVNGQRPVNCLPVPPPASPLKQNSLNTTLTSGCKNLTKSNTVPSRSKIDRCVAKQDTFEVDNDVMPVAPKLRNNPKVKLLQRSHAVREETSPPREVELSHASSNNSTEKIAINKTVNGATNNNNNNNNNSNNNNINNINNNNNNNSSSMINNSNLVNSNSNSSNKNHNNKVGNVTSQTNNPSYQGGNSLQVNNNIVRPNSRHKLRHQGSSQGSVDNSSPCLSRDSSTEQYTDNSGIDLNQFITDTLNRNFKDRMLLLQIEQDLISLVKDTKKAYQKFPVMSSYQRMLVHRVAAFFGMDHNVDQSGNCVVVNITSSTRIPEVRFSELIREDCRFGEEPRRCILKRDSSSFEEGMQLRSPERQLSGDSRRSKSFEEREEEYERARKRIFNRDDGFPIDSPYRSHDINSRRSSHEDLRWHGEPQPWSSSDSDICSGRGRPTSTPRINHISKVESFEGNDTLKANSLKGSVLKSYSFGGYPGMTRGDSISSSGSRPLIKQADSITSSVSSARLSPSSSGYKSQSTRSDATASTTPSPNQATSQCSFSPEPNTVVWAVSSLTAVPPGAVLINPASGQPYTNPDGSLYRYDPDNPIKLCPTIEEDGPTNILSSPNSGTLESNSDTPEDVIQEKLLVDTTDSCVEQTHPGTTDTKLASAKTVTVFINSSTSPSLPELTHNDTMATKEKIHQSESMRVDSSKNGKLIVPCQDETPQINTSSGRLYPSTLDGMSVEVAHTNFNGIESENNSYKDYVGSGDVNGVTNCQGDGREYSGQNNYQVNFAINSNVHNTPEYGSQAASGSAFLNSGLGVASVNYALGPPYSAETVHMPAEMLYSQSVIYAAGQQGNTYGVVHTPATPSTPAAPPPPPPQATAVPAPATATSYEARPNEANPSVAVPELSNYFMGLNIGNEHIPSATTPASQMGYWGPSPNTSQTQGSSHSSQIQMYYLPGSLPTGTIHPKYAPPTPSVYTYNVPPVVYPTEICSSVIPNTATAVFQTPYYAPASNTAMTYRAQTPPTPSAVAATAVAPTGFFVYHPQPAAPPPPQIQFGMVRPQQQVPGIRSSPPPGPRTRMPYNRSISERARHGSFNVDHKANSLHFSPLSVYGLRFMPGEIQPIGMMRPVANVRPTLATSNSNIPRHPIVTQCCANDLTASRPPRPRKQR